MDNAVIEQVMDYESIGKAYKWRKACTKNIKMWSNVAAGEYAVASALGIAGMSGKWDDKRTREYSLEQIARILEQHSFAPQGLGRIAAEEVVASDLPFTRIERKGDRYIVSYSRLG